MRTPRGPIAILIIPVAVLAIFSSCRTATKDLSFQREKNARPFEKLPVTAGLIFDTSITSWNWLPENPNLQWGSPRELHPGRVLQNVSETALAFVFDKIVAAASAQEAWRLEAEALVGFESRIDATRVPSEVKAELKVTVWGIDGRPVLSFTERGRSIHELSPLDDGAIHNAFVDVYEKVIPRLGASAELALYVRDLPRLRGEMTMRAAKKASPAKTTHASAAQPQAAPTQPARPTPAIPAVAPTAPPPSPSAGIAVPAASSPSVAIIGVRLALASDPARPVAVARRGQTLEMVVEYSVSDVAPGATADFAEVRSVTFGGNVLVETKDLSRKPNGTHTTMKTITLPRTASPGGYTLVAAIRMGGRTVAKSFDFDIE